MNILNWNKSTFARNKLILLLWQVSKSFAIYISYSSFILHVCPNKTLVFMFNKNWNIKRLCKHSVYTVNVILCFVYRQYTPTFYISIWSLPAHHTTFILMFMFVELCNFHRTFIVITGIPRVSISGFFLWFGSINSTCALLGLFHKPAHYG